jgi:ketosteroid isomerase-like protein
VLSVLSVAWIRGDIVVRLILAVVVGAAISTGIPRTQNAIPDALAAMAETEREFARTARTKGWRDAFLDFFANDAIAFAPQVMLAKDRLRKQPATPFFEYELVWEPRTGDVAASNDLGWLTGPSTAINHKSEDKKPRYGCYLSVWRKQPDGRWRVFIDVSVDAPEPVSFAPGFNRIAFGRRYSGKEQGREAKTSLGKVDGDLNDRMAVLDLPRAFDSQLTSASRLHRPGSVPVIGRESITKWLEQNSRTGTAKQDTAEAALAGDFGYSYGTFEVKDPKPVTGVYIRLWSRDSDGRWWLVADVAQNIKEATGR